MLFHLISQPKADSFPNGGASQMQFEPCHSAKGGTWRSLRERHAIVRGSLCGQMVQRSAQLAHNQHDQGSNPCLPTTGAGHPRDSSPRAISPTDRPPWAFGGSLCACWAHLRLPILSDGANGRGAGSTPAHPTNGRHAVFDASRAISPA